MTDVAIIERDDAALKVSFTAKAQSIKEDALAVAGVIGKVANPEDQEMAVGAQLALKSTLKLVETARKTAKEPVLEYGRRIDDAARAFSAELVEEMTRVSRLVGDYQTLEQAKANAAERLRREDLAEIERERAAAVAQASSHEALDAVHAHFDRAAADLPLSEPTRAQGQVIKEEVEVQVHDIWALARAHPFCVKVEPLIGEIKNLIKTGVTRIPGVSFKAVIKADVRVGRQPKAIEI